MAADMGGILVAGPPGTVEHVVAELMGLCGEAGRVASKPELSDTAAGLASIYALTKTHGEYVQLSERSLALVREHGAMPSTDGFFRMFVQSAKGRFAGNLEWRPATLGPEQALSLQQTAALLALRAAIKGVQDAVERVEDQLDHVAILVESERVGDALGDRRTLVALVDRLHTYGSVSATDWWSVASLGPHITRDIERLRVYVRKTVGRVKTGWTTRDRAEEAEGLVEQNRLREALATLVLCEQNLALWQELRIAHVRQLEPRHLASTIADARDAIARDRADDQALVTTIRSAVVALARVRGIEGLAPLQRRNLAEAHKEVDTLTSWFADQRLLDVGALTEPVWPSFGDTLRHIGGVALDAASDIGRNVRGLLDRRSDDQEAGPPALPPGELPSD